jgi:tripartite-type tricarboxylate transporter receptor subunit TctC
MRFNAVASALLVVVMTLTSGLSSAQSWPERQVTIIVPSAPGDGSDIAARLIGEKLRIALGQAFVIENRMGAGGVVGSAAAAKAPADGYTFIMGNAGSHGIIPATYAGVPYDALRDFAPVSLIYKAPNIFIASKTLPVSSLAELVAYAKANPGKLSYASGGSGSSAHMNSEYLKVLTGIEATHVPYRGAGPALNDIVSGQIEFMAVNLPPAIGLVTSGKVTPLAVTTRVRAAALPQVKTVAESGFPDYETVAWFGLLAPTGVPEPVIARLHAEVAKACRDAEVQQKLSVLGGETVCSTPAEFRGFLAADIARWKDVATKAGVTLEPK